VADVCDYCGCRALDAIAALTAEHDLVVNLAGEARRAVLAGDLDLAADRARAVAAVLEPHTVVEEGALFPAMAAEYADHVTSLIGEHRAIEDVLAESVELTPTDPTWPARLTAVLRVLREHILKEEDGLFPAALSELDPAQWDHVDAIRARVGSGLPVVVVG
jgi:hemerythrin-like domain-containing protein